LRDKRNQQKNPIFLDFLVDAIPSIPYKRSISFTDHHNTMKKLITTAIGALAVAALVQTSSAQSLPYTFADFEANIGAGNGTVLFQPPIFSGSTSARLVTPPNTSQVTETFPGGNLNAGNAVLNVNWEWSATATSPVWLRLTTFNTATLGNPIISFQHGLSFDIHSDRPLQVALGVRETNSTGDYGQDGGSTVGGIEWIGGNSSGGKAIPANQWTTIFFDIPNETVQAFAGTTANGILESTTGKGVLEHLAFFAADGTGEYNIYLDNFTVVPEPSTIALGILGGLGLLVGYIRRRK
jgi:hypothetical protein